MLKLVGTTPDELIYKGVFSFFETYGVPLDIIFEFFKENHYMVSWIDFYREARAAGISHDRILSRLEEAVTDVWGPAFYVVVKEKLELIFGPQSKLTPIVPNIIIIINE